MKLQYTALYIFLVTVYTTTTAIKIDCENPTGISEDNIHHCCKHPEGHDDVMDICAKETGFKLPSANEEAMVDITADRAIAGTCFAKCVFNKLNFLKGDQLDVSAVKKYYTEKYAKDPEYAKEMINAFDHCHGKAEENSARFLSNPMFQSLSKEFCDPKPGVIWACVIRQFFHNCPTNRWSKTPECSTLLDFSKSCENAMTSM